MSFLGDLLHLDKHDNDVAPATTVENAQETPSVPEATAHDLAGTAITGVDLTTPTTEAPAESPVTEPANTIEAANSTFVPPVAQEVKPAEQTSQAIESGAPFQAADTQPAVEIPESAEVAQFGKDTATIAAAEANLATVATPEAATTDETSTLQSENSEEDVFKPSEVPAVEDTVAAGGPNEIIASAEIPAKGQE